MLAKLRERAKLLIDSYYFLFLLSVLIGIALFKLFIFLPSVGVITLDTSFLSENSRDSTIEMLRYAGDESSIKAVAIVIDSPGGEVSKVEEIYLEILKLRKKKPVVVSVNSDALSGGYYIASAADFIYVKPSSQVGNIGVISTLPEPLKPDDEQTITTGPFKTTGKSRREYVAQVEAIKQRFILAITSQRNEKLKLDSEHLATAEIFLGAEAVKYGLADNIGTNLDAVQKAASMAKISNYNTVDINKALNVTFGQGFFSLAKANKTNTPVNYYIYVELTE